MKDTDWEILYRLYETPNMTKVADMLYISQPSLTKRVKSNKSYFERGEIYSRGRISSEAS